MRIDQLAALVEVAKSGSINSAQKNYTLRSKV